VAVAAEEVIASLDHSNHEYSLDRSSRAAHNALTPLPLIEKRTTAMLTIGEIQAAVRIAAVIQAVAATLEAADAMREEALPA
jgi:hypothetical protein